MARAQAVARRTERAELAEIEDWYRWRLTEPAELPAYRWEPVRIGPTWQTETVLGVRRWVLPERSLGWECLAWSGRYLQETRGVPWRFTPEQARFLLWWYAVDETGRWLYRDFVLQRLKGWGKDPLGACMCLFEMVGNCRVADLDDLRVIGEDNPDAWVQTAAVALKQTKNTMRLLPGLITPEARSTYGISPTKEIVYAVQSTRIFEAITSSPETLEGARASFLLRNEALSLDVRIPTPDGWTDMKSVLVGDHLIGSDGRPTRVTYVTEPQLGRQCYRVAFADGTSVIASDGHLWQTRPVGPMTRLKPRTTAELLADGRRFRVPRAEALRTPDRELPVDPYVLGLWLGDGAATRPIISASDADIEELEALVRARGFTTKRNKPQSDRAPRFTVSVAGARRNRNDHRTTLSLHGQLSAEGLFGNKHVPAEYLRAGYQQRVDLLRGLMDSDGCAGADGRAIFINTSDRLADAMIELLRSLGQRPSRSWVRDNRARLAGYHRISFTPRKLVPFSLTRKVARVRPAKAASDWLSITAIEPVESEPVKCVEVDAEDHLFLVGEGWTVTHNTQHWLATNAGHDMADVIERNATKSPGGSARTGSITNAFEEGEDSVAERDRWAYDSTMIEGKAASVRLLYDSLEAHPDAPLSAEDAPDVIDSVRGDSTWLDIPTIVDSIRDVRRPPSQSRRFWYNQVQAAEDAWMLRHEWDACARPGQLVLPDERAVMFFDGSKSQDSTGLVGCRLSDGLLWRIGHWMPTKEQPLVPRDEVDLAVQAAMDSYKIVAFWGDPSHALDDEAESYWDGLFDEWHRRYARQLLIWSTRAGDGAHAVMWDMSNHQRLVQFTAAAQQFVAEATDGQLVHDGDRLLRQHVLNARKRPNKWGVSLGKVSRDSTRKIDLAVCAVGARMLRRVVLNKGAGQRQRSGKVW